MDLFERGRTKKKLSQEPLAVRMRPRTLDELVDAVKKCWAAIWTHRAYEYRRANSITHLDVQMAVIVQRLINADASGVLFTVNPATSKPDRVVIESCSGLGETLVSGKVTPDCFHIGRRTRWLLRQTISTSCRFPNSA